VREFKVGDEVFGRPSRYFGAHAEYVCVSERAALAPKPLGMSFEEAAAVCDGASQALDTLRQADVQAGRRIVIYGASGSLGTAAVQLAKHFGAHVTAVCGTDHVELVRSLGADEVVDYRRQDFTRNGQTYDAIIDAVGTQFCRGRRSLTPGGIHVATDGGRFLLGDACHDGRGDLICRQQACPHRDRSTDQGGRRSSRSLIEAGEFRAVVDRRYPMDQVVEAHRYVETWHKAGNVVLTIAAD
jgi:NADPH:quinone reductase-like Zn-dependent oxidoreductase